MTDKYILEDHKPVLCPDIIEWATWYENADRKVVQTQITDDIMVSTVFLGLNHNFGKGPPLLFETMIFGGPLDQKMERYSTWKEAEKNHKRWVAKAKGE